MPKQVKNYNVAEMQPDELNALRATAKEFIERVTSIENEIDLLKEDRKGLIEDFKVKLDVKTLQAALRVIKIQRGVQHKDTFDMFMEALTESTD